MKKKSVWVVMAVKESAEVHLRIASLGLDEKKELSFSQMAEGCFGALLVFRKKSDAKKYAGKYPVVEMEDLGKGSVL